MAARQRRQTILPVTEGALIPTVHNIVWHGPGDYRPRLVTEPAGRHRELRMVDRRCVVLVVAVARRTGLVGRDLRRHRTRLMP
jgi:hypothetical protein